MSHSTSRIFIFLGIIMITLSGCAIFKKKCDCPGFGNADPAKQRFMEASIPQTDDDPGGNH